MPETPEEQWWFVAHLFMKTYGYTFEEFLEEKYVVVVNLLREMEREAKIEEFEMEKKMPKVR